MSWRVGNIMPGDAPVTTGIDRVYGDKLIYAGDLAFGESIEFDAENHTVTLTSRGSETNVISKMTGNFIEILSGTNYVHYTDDEAARTVGISVTKKDRYI